MMSAPMLRCRSGSLSCSAACRVLHVTSAVVYASCSGGLTAGWSGDTAACCNCSFLMTNSKKKNIISENWSVNLCFQKAVYAVDCWIKGFVAGPASDTLPSQCWFWDGVFCRGSSAVGSHTAFLQAQLCILKLFQECCFSQALKFFATLCYLLFKRLSRQRVVCLFMLVFV